MTLRMTNLPGTVAGVTIGLLVVIAPTRADDWPQWRGPDRTGVSVETGWSESGAPEPLWRKELGFGHASFAIADGRLYTLGHDLERGLDVVYCLDAATGAEHWRYEYASEFWDNSHDGGALTTPTVAGPRMYTSNREGNLTCLRVDTGEVIWNRNLRADLDVEPPTWGFSASPLLVDGEIIMNVGRIAAFDAVTGATRWTTETNYGDAYSTPAPFRHDGAPRLAVLAGNGLALLDRDHGAELGFYGWFQQPPIFPMTPVIVGDDRIFISAGYNRGCVMLRVTDDGLETVWESRVMRNKMAGAVLFEDHLYGFDESILKCVDLDGSEQWRKRGLGAGTLSIAGQRLLIIDGKGAIVIAEANPRAYAELTRNDVLDGGTYWSTPVLSDGLVYCRNSLGSMACLDYRVGAVERAGVEFAASDAPLPSAEDLIARHVAASGGAVALGSISSLQFFGEGEHHQDAVEHGAIEVRWQAGGGFAWEMESGYQYAHDGERGWSRPGSGMPTILDKSGLDALRLGGQLSHLLAPHAHYASLRTAEAVVFDDRHCYVVDAETTGGAARRLYFDATTGLCAGSEGEGAPLWTFSDYRETEGVMLPMRWSFYEPEQGEMRTATFDRVVVNGALAEDAFAPTELVALMMRSPEEKEAANERLRTTYLDLLGEWMMVDDPPRPAIIDVAEGFLRLHLPMRPEPGFINEPNDEDRLVLLAFPFVWLQIERNEEGQAEAMTLTVFEEAQGRLVRDDTGDDGGD